MDRLSLDSLDGDFPSEESNVKHFDEERQTERQIRIVQLKIILQRQMNELKQKEDQVNELFISIRQIDNGI